LLAHDLIRKPVPTFRDHADKRGGVDGPGQGTVSVIPDRHEVASPESIIPVLGLWIPGSRAGARAPE
jgi:hypothetical protein